MSNCRTGRLLFGVVLYVCIGSLSIRAAGIDTVARATLSAAEARLGIARAQGRVFAFRFTYEVTHPSDEGWPVRTYLRRTVAGMSPHFFFHESHPLSRIKTD